VEDSPICKRLNEHGDLVDELSHPWRNCFFALFIVEQKKMKTSNYKSFIDSLPLDVSNYPVMFGQEERELLKGSQMIGKIDDRVRSWQSDYEAMCEAEPQIRDMMTFIEFKESKQIVSSRAYDIGYTDGTTRQVLIPYVDMALINSSSDPNVTCLQYDGYLRLQANRNIKCGEIIVQAKSVACNTSVFLNSGFITSNNQNNNKIEVEAELDQNDPLYSDKKNEIEQQ